MSADPACGVPDCRIIQKDTSPGQSTPRCICIVSGFNTLRHASRGRVIVGRGNMDRKGTIGYLQRSAAGYGKRKPLGIIANNGGECPFNGFSYSARFDLGEISGCLFIHCQAIGFRCWKDTQISVRYMAEPHCFQGSHVPCPGTAGRRKIRDSRIFENTLPRVRHIAPAGRIRPSCRACGRSSCSDAEARSRQEMAGIDDSGAGDCSLCGNHRLPFPLFCRSRSCFVPCCWVLSR